MAKARKGVQYFETAHNITDTQCPICGKNFIPAPFHMYKTRDSIPKLVCSNACDKQALKNYRAEFDKKKAQQRARYRAKHPLHVEMITPEKWAICTACGFVKETYQSQSEAEQALENWRD